MKRFYCKSVPSGPSSMSQCSPVGIIHLNRNLALLTRSSRHRDALNFFKIIHSGRLHARPDAYTLSTIISASFNLRHCCLGNQLHVLAVKFGFISSVHVANAILAFYGKTFNLESLKLVFEDMRSPDAFSYSTLLSSCARMGDLRYAFKVFDVMPHRDITSWNSLVAGCIGSGNVLLSMSLFRDICRSEIMYDSYTLSNVLRGSAPGWMEFSVQVHSMVIKSGFLGSTSVLNALITMYVENDDIDSAKTLFNECDVTDRNVVTYNVMLDCFARMGRIEETQLLFKEMVGGGIEPNVPSFVNIFSSCSDLVFGNQINSFVQKMGFDCVTQVSNATMTMYSNCGIYGHSVKVFNSLKQKDNVSWNALFSCYSQANLGNSAVLAFKDMLKGMIEPDEFSFGTLLSCAETSEIVEIMHAFALKCGLTSCVSIVNSLITGYSNNEKMDEAYAVFSYAQGRNLITWNTLIYGFVKNTLPKEGLKLFSELISSDTEPDEFSLNMALSICCAMSASTLGKQIHCRVMVNGYFGNVRLGNGLISFYSKSGDRECCERIFNLMRCKDVVTWNGMISAYAQHGEGLKAVRCYEAMDVGHDDVTLRAVLWACCSAGLMDEAKRVFNAMVEPKPEHVAAIVSLLVRWGHLDDVQDLIKGDPDMWWAALSSCSVNCDLNVTRIVGALLLKVGNHRERASVHVALANAYASAGQWAQAASTRLLFDRVQLKKQTGLTWICR